MRGTVSCIPLVGFIYEIRREKGVYIREISGGLRMFGLLFRQESCQGDDVGVDVLLSDRRVFAVGSRHGDDSDRGIVIEGRDRQTGERFIGGQLKEDDDSGSRATFYLGPTERRGG